MNTAPTGVLYRRSDDFVYHLAVGEHLLVSLHARQEEPLYVLTETGAELWQRLADWRSIPDLVKHLVTEYDISPVQASADVEEFIEQLLSLRALETADETPAHDS